MNIPFGMMPCPDPDCANPGECYGLPEDYSNDLTEPDECESCQSREAMDWKHSDSAWICADCGYAHVRDGAIRQIPSLLGAGRYVTSSPKICWCGCTSIGGEYCSMGHKQ